MKRKNVRQKKKKKAKQKYDQSINKKKPQYK